MNRPPREQFELFRLPEAKSLGVSVRPLVQPIWTGNKARLIEAYLRYFVLITKHGCYIDGFAGPQRKNATDSWSAKRVLESMPPFLRQFYLFDCNDDQVRSLQALAARFDGQRPSRALPRRRVSVMAGDFNSLVVDFLAARPIRAKEATFCLLDQRTFECHWKTVELLAKYKPLNENKIEIFYFLAQGWLARALRATKATSTLELWWGRSDWDCLRKLSPLDRAVLFCDRFRDLGYKDVKPWPIYRSSLGSRVMYHMIHATDHAEAPKLMRRAYERALGPPEPQEQFLLEFQS